MQTRLYRKQHLFNEVSENPLLLTTIMNYLDNKDAVNFSLTNKKYHLYDSIIGNEVITPKLAEGYVKYLDEQHKKVINKTNDKFMSKFRKLLRQYESSPFNSCLKFKVFYHIFEYKDFLFSNYEKYKVFLNATEENLIRLIRNDHSYETIDAVHYLTLIFDIQPKAERIPGTSNDYVEYIISTKGERILI